MATEQEIVTYSGRLETFKQSHRLAKRRSSSTSKKKTNNTVTWPHQTPTPEELAQAGFFYKPTATSPDSVTCFLCNQSLDGWDAEDNPATEHLAHVPHCGWAINVCIEMRSQDADRAEEDPMNEHLVEARRATFKDFWPHEGKKGWKCKVTKMVDAGWCYSPLPEADDCVHCFYCGVSLDGWEPKDDPLQEHRKRAPECHFFTLVEESKKLQQSKKTKKGRTSKTTRNSRLSTQSNVTVTEDFPSLPELDVGLDDDTLDADEDTIMTSASAMSKPTKKGAKGTKATKTSAARTTRTRKNTVDEEASSSQPAASQSVSQSAAEEQPPEDVAEEAELQPSKTRAKKSTKKTTKQDEEPIVVIEEPEAPAKPKRATRKKPTRKDSVMSDDAQQLHSELQDSVHNVESAPLKPAMRGKKRLSDGSEKQDSSVIIVEHRTEPQSQQAPVSAAPIEQNNPPTRKRGRPSKRSQPIEILEDQPATAAAPPSQPTPLQDQTASPQSDPQPEPAKARGRQKSADKATKQQKPPSKRQSTPRPSPSPELPPPRSVTHSPQSSDAENQNPSSRPSFTASQEQQPAPVASSPGHPINTSPARKTNFLTPTQSPAKLVGTGADPGSDSNPWTRTDLATAFLLSPGSRAAQGSENLVLEDVFARLSAAERQMSVHEWILWNAKGAEDRLKAECERLVGVFEGEGVRAMRVLEAVECTS